MTAHRVGGNRLIAQCLCLLALGVQVLAGSLHAGMQTQAGVVGNTDLQVVPSLKTTAQSQQPEDAGLRSAANAVLSSRRLLREGDEGIILAAGPVGAVIQYAGDNSEQPPLTHTRVLLGKDDHDDDEEEEEEEDDKDSKKGDADEDDNHNYDEEDDHDDHHDEEDDDDDDHDNEDDEEEDDDDDDKEGVEVDITAIVGVHVKQFRAPKGLGKQNGKLLKRKNGELLMVETPVSPRFSKYVAKNEDFLKRIAYDGTVHRRELNAICKKVAKGKTNFKADLNVDEAKGAPDTGDDITGAKVDHQFGCTVTKGPKVKLNPKLKDGVVFALLELGKTSNLIDCQKGVKKCNMWTLLDDADVEDLTDLYGYRRRLLAKPAAADAAAVPAITPKPTAGSGPSAKPAAAVVSPVATSVSVSPVAVAVPGAGSADPSKPASAASGTGGWTAAKIPATGQTSAATKLPATLGRAAAATLPAVGGAAVSATQPAAGGAATSATLPAAGGAATSATLPAAGGAAASATLPAAGGAAASATLPAAGGAATSATLPAAEHSAAVVGRPRTGGGHGGRPADCDEAAKAYCRAEYFNLYFWVPPYGSETKEDKDRRHGSKFSHTCCEIHKRTKGKAGRTSQVDMLIANIRATPEYRQRIIEVNLKNAGLYR